MENVDMPRDSDTTELRKRHSIIIGRILNFLRQIGKRPVAVDDLTGEDSVKAGLDGDYYVVIPFLGKRR